MPALFIVILGFIAYFVARAYESGAARAYLAELLRVWRSWNVPARCLMVALLILCAVDGRTKGASPLAGVYRLLFWQPQAWTLLPSSQDAAAASAANVAATNSIAVATNTAAAVENYVDTNHVATLSFDWHSPNRLPYHDRQNVLGRTVWVSPTNINGVLYEDHYVAFNEAATTNPAVILIEYAALQNDGMTVLRFQAETVTNSYPVMVPITLQSGVHTCYWFRCAVPVAFTNGCVRDWNGEALFGAPADSGKGFDLLGTLVVDDGDQVWVGATTNMVVAGVTNEVRNGIIVEAKP